VVKQATSPRRKLIPHQIIVTLSFMLPTTRIIIGLSDLQLCCVPLIIKENNSGK
jgi:hypothetical protein